MENYHHLSVLLHESIEALNIKPDGIYVDGTAGGGGHSFEIASRLKTGRLIAIDRDPDAIKAAGKRLEPFKDRVTLVNANFSQLSQILNDLGIPAVDGILLDLGVSSYQFDVPERGFSYNYDAPLDMRMSKSGISARDIVNSASQDELARILREYGEEKFASRIASHIVFAREKKPIETTFELSEIVKSAIPAAARRSGPHPARRTFQALRIAVNGELDELGALLDDALSLLAKGGRLAVITFHSLEDRMVKQRFLSWAQGCTCPPDFPICVCGHKPQVVIPKKKGIEPSKEEIEINPRSRSARLRFCEKL
ncbi:Ribosomal RNA small subunit methyltransferase H [[Clostridium] cellulosi]|jgi:S-adenosyl-methyltransferase MraW|uniref:Ribosomal RNA small subunit methyltransferase H n=1 Tax=[Clostridium] cellulosi TaxID=29343 RepID=A0A078KTD6_9FIRM|nr:Ribosomal RNA small subunit methyltransferase H [[Clostridium] cellulosi]